MHPDLHQKLLKEINTLKTEIRKYSTQDVLGSIGSYWLPRYISGESKTEFVSPGKQPDYLIGLMLGSPEPDNPARFTRKKWKWAISKLNDIVGIYAKMFWPNPTEIENMDATWHQAREVAMPAFLYHFNTGILASVEQVVDLITRYISPFDAEIENKFKINSREMLEVADFLKSFLEKQLSDILNTFSEENKARHEIIDKGFEGSLSIKEMRGLAKTYGYQSILENRNQFLKSLFIVSLSDITSKFGKAKAEAFWALFITKRGIGPDLVYLTDKNTAEIKSGYIIGDDSAIFPNIFSVFTSIYNCLESHLLSGKSRERFLKNRDARFEEHVVEVFKRIFKDEPTARFIVQGFETEDLHFEHDLIILFRDRLLVVEAKASPPKEPFRDPDKAFLRIKDSFKSGGGIQSAFNQTERIRNLHATGIDFPLYNKKREIELVINPPSIKRVHSICITKDHFGALAVELSLLLEKEPASPYPWVASVRDVEAILEAWDYLGWGPDKFIDYTEQRESLHGKVFSNDELEFAGYYIQHDGLHWLDDVNCDKMFLEPKYAHILDDIYRAKKGGIKFEHNPTKPFFTKLSNPNVRRQDYEEFSLENSLQLTTKINQGRNEKCQCGSGKKFKKCCDLLIVK